MSKFFDSEIIQEEIEEINELQKMLYSNVMQFPTMEEQLHKTIPLMGFPRGTDMNLLFEGMKETISKLKENIDKS